MRQRIIEALTYPRMMLLANLREEECPQHLLFNLADEKCRLCEQGEECRWLTSNDEFSVLVKKPMQQLVGSLQFCIDYVDAHCRDAKHNVRRCPCESCEWVRSARQLASACRHVH